MVNGASETNTALTDVFSIIEGIRTGRWKSPVDRVKARYTSAFEAAKKQGDQSPYMAAKEAARNAKKELSGVLFSGEFSERANDKIISHSGVLCLDIDHLEDGASLKHALADDDHVQAFFASPTGSGLKVLLRIEPSKDSHERSFLAAEKYFLDRYGIKVDNCKDVARLCFVSHDENIFIREQDAALLEPKAPEPKAEPHAPSPARDMDAELTAKCGPAFYVTEKNSVVINQNYFVQRICRENLVFFEFDETRFYRYNAGNGAWEAVAPGFIKELVRSEWERLTRLFDEPALAFKATAGLLHALLTGVESHSGRAKVFKRLKNIIHCANGMLKISSEGAWELMPFSPTYYARNPILVA
jgi:hypothetical protein